MRVIAGLKSLFAVLIVGSRNLCEAEDPDAAQPVRQPTQQTFRMSEITGSEFFATGIYETSANQPEAADDEKKSEDEEPDEEESDEPETSEHSKLNTQDADPLGKGAWQLQFNVGYARAGSSWSDSWHRQGRKLFRERVYDMALNYGVHDDLDLGFGVGYSWLNDNDADPDHGSGMNDLALAAKWRFAEDEDRGLGFAWVPSLVVPSGRSATSRRLGISQDYWSFDNRVAIVKDWTECWSTNFDIGYEHVFDGGQDLRGVFGANAAVGYKLRPWFQPEFELNYTHDIVRSAGDADLLAVTVGAAMPISERLVIRAGVQQGIAGRNTDRSTTLLLSIDLNF